ncbi:MAG: DUF4062 domain-containing protein [Chitinophagaceae bacterium]|nr:DUF4062 domain-containing protein [Chitinophagaceae bacterium]
MFITQPKIFISSTVSDLSSERTAAYNAVNRVGGFPVMSEKTMEAQSTDSLTACLSKVMESDIYVLILGSRYGWQPIGKESITELEYQTARNQNIPIIVINTTHPKELLQNEFEGRVESNYFRKTVNDAYELEIELEKALIFEISKKQKEYFNKTESIYSNLVKIHFPNKIYIAELDIDKKAVKQYNKEARRPFYKPSLHDFAVSALYMHGISFAHDWIVWDGKIITFHNIQDDTVGLTKIIDKGTIELFACDEFYETSQDHISQFKYLLKKCLESKLHKRKIKWFKEEKLFAFLPVRKDDSDKWLTRSIEWKKTSKKATRKVVDINDDLKNKDKVYNLKCLAFRTGFENFGNDWYIALKPEWIYLWNDLRVCPLAFKNIQWLKRNERNMHVFNHFNFILRYLQPSQTESLFPEYRDYPFLRLEKIEKFDFAPIVPDSIWNNLESIGIQKKLMDENSNIDLFGI